MGGTQTTSEALQPEMSRLAEDLTYWQNTLSVVFDQMFGKTSHKLSRRGEKSMKQLWERFQRS